MCESAPDPRSRFGGLLQCAGRLWQSSRTVGRRRVAHRLSDRLGLAVDYGNGFGDDDAVDVPDTQHYAEYNRKLKPDSFRDADILVAFYTQHDSNFVRKFKPDSFHVVYALINFFTQRDSKSDGKL